MGGALSSEAPTSRPRRRVGRELTREWKRRTLPWIVRAYARKPETRDLASLWNARGEDAARLRVLVVRPDNRLGNLVLLTPFLRALRAAQPSAEIVMLTGDVYAELGRGFPWVDQWIVQPKRTHATQPWRFFVWLHAIRARGWDLAFEMSNHNTHSYYSCVLAVASGAPVRVGFDEPRNAGALTHSAPAPDDRLPMALAPLALLERAGLEPAFGPPEVPVAPTGSPRWEAWRRDTLGAAPYLIAHVGGRGGKSWPLDSWLRLLPRISLRPEARLVLLGGPDETDRLAILRERAEERVREGAGPSPSFVIAPPLPLADLVQFLRGAELYLGCDTGVMHLAAAVGTPTVALFFRSNPYHYAPLGSRHHTVILADPYGVRERGWERALPGGLERSAISFALPSDEESRRGAPRTDRAADEAILAAIEGAMALAGARTPRSAPS